MCQKCKKEKIGVTDFVSEIKRRENYPDFEKFAHVIQHRLQGFIAKNIKVSQRRQIILVIFRRSRSVSQIILNVTNVFTKT